MKRNESELKRDENCAQYKNTKNVQNFIEFHELEVYVCLTRAHNFNATLTWIREFDSTAKEKLNFHKPDN